MAAAVPTAVDAAVETAVETAVQAAAAVETAAQAAATVEAAAAGAGMRQRRRRAGRVWEVEEGDVSDVGDPEGRRCTAATIRLIDVVQVRCDIGKAGCAHDRCTRAPCLWVGSTRG